MTVVMVVGLASGCGATRADDRGGDTLRVVGPFEIHSLEPTATSGFFTRLEVAETLVTADLEGNLAPGLASDWSPSQGGRTWTFELVPDVTFHDGTPLTPEAAVDSLETVRRDEASPLAAAPIEQIAATDTGLRFELSEPNLTLPAVLTHYSTMILAPAAYDDDDHVSELIGTGPYRIDRIELPASIEVTRFDDWRGTPPEIEKVSFQSVSRAESRALMATSDDADVVWHLEPAGRQKVEASDGVSMASTLQPRTIMLKVNNDHPILGDPDVRRALSMALDREAMAEAVLREPELAATQLMPPSLTTWSQPDLAPLEHDADGARQLLESAGWEADDDGVLTKDGEALRLNLLTYPDRPELPALATAIQASAKEVGIEIDVEVTNSSEIPVRHADDTLELALVARHFALVSDPLVTVAETFAPAGSEWGVQNWSDPQLTAAVDQLLTGPSEDRAEELRATIVTIAQEQLPLVPVAWYRMNAAVQDRVEGFVFDPLETSWHFSQVRWAS
ncbi:ABC transporter substrate-binding protein [Nocardioides bizhenqiangii]|uniref:ABC transporter substrate-binding protein n=1 Tax=Nocardioides bizhenqiangii TaxID=3095076 RepID=A0ABZ0ZW96_9ACTN|nr:MULTISPECIES: ABC transporter substrate-binding protein [unclassified Nocardioides]MDZ5621766.1 ABC transporter substrate-binding protein [Nocardioides sp. HM23]WQQ27548.1 ABC transporter substrate-binding protein [Nocardioides sp. HM61]